MSLNHFLVNTKASGKRKQQRKRKSWVSPPQFSLLQAILLFLSIPNPPCQKVMNKKAFRGFLQRKEKDRREPTIFLLRSKCFFTTYTRPRVAGNEELIEAPTDHYHLYVQHSATLVHQSLPYFCCWIPNMLLAYLAMKNEAKMSFLNPLKKATLGHSRYIYVILKGF